MNCIELPGQEHNAFDHLTAYGLAAILEGSAPARIRLGWTDTLEPRLRLSGADWDTVGDVVHAHAVAHTQAHSWVQSNGVNAGVSRGLFSPRVKAMSPAEMAAWYGAREAAIDAIDGQSAALDRCLIGALGAPSYWSFEYGGPRPDHGASRWEMKTRNRGAEFVGNRLRPLAAAVASRTPAQVADGLSGTTTVDEVGKNQDDSRTPTGLMPPGVTDNARAWCALWGLSLLPIIHDTTGVSHTAGHLGEPGRGCFYLPIMTRMWPMARLKNVLATRQLLLAATTGLDASGRAVMHVSDTERQAAWAWLLARGAPAVIRFPVHRSANGKAPERWAQQGFRILPGRMWSAE